MRTSRAKELVSATGPQDTTRDTLVPPPTVATRDDPVGDSKTVPALNFSADQTSNP